MGCYVALFIASRQHLWNFFGGMFAGALIAIFVALIGSPPGWIANYQLGAWGESRTARTLMPLLEDGWFVVHDISRWISNLDHVLVGPGGIFVLDTKNYQGTVTVERGQLSISHGDGAPSTYFGDTLARRSRAQGAALHDILARRNQRGLWVSAVVVFWADFPQQRVDGDRVTYVHGDALVSWLREQPQRLPPERVAKVSDALRPGRRRREDVR